MNYLLLKVFKKYFFPTTHSPTPLDVCVGSSHSDAGHACRMDAYYVPPLIFGRALMPEI